MEHKISKEKFIQSINEILAFNKNLSKLETILGTYLIEAPIFNNVANITDYLVNAMSNYNDETIDLINWWLYEDVEKVLYLNGEETSVRTPEELYDYLVDNKYF